MNRTCKLLLAPIFLFLLCFFLFVARHRFIDGDEGLYVVASRLVLQHRAPYLDFFYQQTPLLPYAYAFWMKLFGISWFSVRSFSAVLTTILGLLIYEQVCHETRRWTAGLAAMVLYVSCTFVFAWFPVVKTYSLAALFLFGAYVIVSRLLPASPLWLVAVAGLLFGLSVDTRSYVAGIAPIFLWWVFRDSETRIGIARVLCFLGGFTIGILPSLYFFFASPGLFMFNNLGYHAMRSQWGLIGAWGSKIRVARILLFALGYEGNGVQFCLLSAMSLAAVLVSRIRRDTVFLAFLIALLLAFVSILPTPPMVQSFCLCVPFLILAAVCGTSDYIASLHAARPKRIAVLACAALLATFVVSSLPSVSKHFITGDYAMLSGTNYAPNWTLDGVSAVSQAIDQLATPHEEIASFWPGYIFASKADPYPGFENNFGQMVANKVTAQKRAKYHIISDADFEADFAAHTPRIAVVGNQEIFVGPPRASTCARILRSNGYTVARTIGDTSIFVCCSLDPTSEPPSEVK
jgi:4-amino-4-deoxy-L-arabinose transferase-like glycosyltransferase